MALPIDTSRAFRSHDELTLLIKAVAGGALPEDEGYWIEWKIAGDLTKKATLGTAARHVLGMANRLPARAVLHGGAAGT